MCDSLKKEIDNFDEANKGEAHAEAHHAAQVGYQGVQGHHLVVRSFMHVSISYKLEFHTDKYFIHVRVLYR